MRRICGWCGKTLDPPEAEPLDDPKETTGICPTCEVKNVRQLYAGMTDEQLDVALSTVLSRGNYVAKLEALAEYKKRGGKG